ncbi:PIN domain-containing protein [Gordonia pseudamarae]|uniref:hypothetical protein n=1 Tax=Gordonia pseudamarae TaxID=2831662 RepID=UPI0019B8D2CB|nr:hypothetical protein [Gordonia sp. (in: high G+C Gram-positive bacteria)]MBD0021417.1 hypothetical protein [Gordonia sp. (in: high G+C Gram-positive bacteria)]
MSRADGDIAADLWCRGDGLSLGDRLCLALGHRRALPVLTADRAWGGRDGVEKLR